MRRNQGRENVHEKKGTVVFHFYSSFWLGRCKTWLELISGTGAHPATTWNICIYIRLAML